MVVLTPVHELILMHLGYPTEAQLAAMISERLGTCYEPIPNFRWIEWPRAFPQWHRCVAMCSSDSRGKANVFAKYFWTRAVWRMGMPGLEIPDVHGPAVVIIGPPDFLVEVPCRMPAAPKKPEVPK